MSGIDLNLALDLAQNIALKSGSLIKDNLRFGINRTWKADFTPVTKIDKQINKFVIRAIHHDFPTHNILGEEQSVLGDNPDYVWVCDPLDGTFPFIHGIPTSTFVLSLVYKGQPILGVIYDPFTQRLFSAVKGGGAKLNSKTIKCDQHRSLTDASIGVVFWSGNSIPITNTLNHLIQTHRIKVFNLASIAYMDVLVAAGEFAATIFPGESPHDSAAAKIIIEEAGGVFSPLTGDFDHYDQNVHGHLACANQVVYNHIKSLLG